MDNKSNIEDIYTPSGEIELRKLFQILWKGKWLVIAITTFFSIAVVIYSLSLPNIYKSAALLNAEGNQEDVNGAIRSYGGLASLAGINLPTQPSNSNALKALDKLKSLSFFEDNIFPNISLPDLMAMDSWDSNTNSISYNNNIFDEKTQTWIRDIKFPKKKVPSAQESFDIFKTKHLSVSENEDTGFITIAIKHQSPFIAKEWTELIVRELNHFFRVKDKEQAQAAVDYLNKQISQTSFTEVKQVIAQLLQQKTQQLTLIEVSEFYVFDYIDPPAVMENKYEPKRSIICIFGALIGGIIGVLIVFARHFFFVKSTGTKIS